MLPRTWSGIGIVLVLGCGADLPPVTDSGPSGLPLDPDVPALDISREELADAPALRLVESLRLGTPEVSDEYVLGSPSDVEVTAEGDVYVLDFASREVMVFDSAGSLRFSFAGEGDGPGEIGTYGPELILSPDTVFLFEVGPQELHAFSREGDHLYTRTVGSRPEGSGGPVRFGRSPIHGVVWTAEGLLGPSRTFNSTIEEVGVGYTDTLVFHLRRHESGMFGESGLRLLGFDFRSGERGTFGMPPFAGTPEHTVLSDGHVLFRRGTDYVLRLAELDGEVVRYVRGTVPRIPTTDADLDRLVDAARADLEQASGDDAEAAVREMRSMPRSAWRPIAGRLMAGNDGTVLVEREDLDSLSTMRRAYATTWDVLDLDEAEVLGRLTMPAGFVPFVYRDSRLYGVNRSDLIPTVIRYDVVGPDGRLLGTAATAPPSPRPPS